MTGGQPSSTDTALRHSVLTIRPSVRLQTSDAPGLLGVNGPAGLLILDDIAYVQKDQAETSVLFELISARYERRSLLITANPPFGAWDQVFPDETTAVAAVDRLVHHATILEMNVESYRRRAALDRSQKKRGRPASYATEKNTKD